ncbi:MAG: hypothetical protein U0Q03_00870 [Acidimicrobiales bacterium]
MTVMVVQAAPHDLPLPGPLRAATSRVAQVSGLYQSWGLFAPPRNETLRLEARVEFADGTTDTWTPPFGGDLLGAYADYHWQKYVEHAARRGNGDEWPRLWAPLARHAARELATATRVPVRVVLLGRHLVNIDAVANGTIGGTQYVDEYFVLDLGTGATEGP